MRVVCLDQQPNVVQTQRAQCARAYPILTMNRQSLRAGAFCYICLRFAIDRWTELSSRHRHHHACCWRWGRPQIGLLLGSLTNS